MPIKSATEYIETVYGTERLARTLITEDAISVMDLMQDFSDHNHKESKAPEMLDMLQKVCIARRNGQEMPLLEIESLINKVVIKDVKQ